MISLPKPNTQAISWFFNEYQKGTLDLDPKYQRKPVWLRGQQCFLIDSLLSGCPIPQVYLNIITKGKGVNRKSVYEVVDGQQRLRTIIDYMRDRWELIEIKMKSYPISKEYTQYIGRKYSDLPDSKQNEIWNYVLAVQELREWNDEQIQALFRRLNIVNVGLTKQELRHSQYFGAFIDTVEQLAEDNLFADIGLFSPNDYRRMRDIEFISELLIIVIDGIQNQQNTIDDFYMKYDFEFPKRNSLVREFRKVIASLESIELAIKETRFSKKADFYALFAATLEHNRLYKMSVDLKYAEKRLRSFASQVENLKTNLSAEYHSTVIEGPNKIKKRILRKDILISLFES